MPFVSVGASGVGGGIIRGRLAYATQLVEPHGIISHSPINPCRSVGSMIIPIELPSLCPSWAMITVLRRRRAPRDGQVSKCGYSYPDFRCFQDFLLVLTVISSCPAP